MKFTEAKREMLALLRRDPAAPAPRCAADTAGALHEWKVQMRAYDAAQIELGIATPHQVQVRNSALRVEPGTVRVTWDKIR